jgi:hypothetical protein
MNDVTNKGSQPHADTLELINSELIGRLDRQTQASAQIDTKAGLLVGYAAVAASFLATRHSQPALTWMAFAAFAVSAGFGVASYAVGAYEEVPVPRHLFNEYVHRPRSDALAALAARRVGAFESNLPRHKRKAARWRISLIALMLGIAFMFGALYVHTGSHGRHGHRPSACGRLAASGPAASRPGRLTPDRPGRLTI